MHDATARAFASRPNAGRAPSIGRPENALRPSGSDHYLIMAEVGYINERDLCAPRDYLARTLRKACRVGSTTLVCWDEVYMRRRMLGSLCHRLTRRGRAKTASGCSRNLRSAPAISDLCGPRIGSPCHRTGPRLGNQLSPTSIPLLSKFSDTDSSALIAECRAARAEKEAGRRALRRCRRPNCSARSETEGCILTAAHERRRPGDGVRSSLTPHVEPIVPKAINFPPFSSRAEPTATRAAVSVSRPAGGPSEPAPNAKDARTFQPCSCTPGIAQTAVLLTAAREGGYASLNALVKGALVRELQRFGRRVQRRRSIFRARR